MPIAMILTTETLVAAKPEREAAPAPGIGGMGDGRHEVVNAENPQRLLPATGERSFFFIW
jgi:hypothetical protein